MLLCFRVWIAVVLNLLFWVKERQHQIVKCGFDAQDRDGAKRWSDWIDLDFNDEDA
jgi:hypothetical protein